MGLSWHILVVWIVKNVVKMFLAINNKDFFLLFCDLEFGDQVVIFTKSNKKWQLQEKVLFGNIFRLIFKLAQLVEEAFTILTLNINLL